MAGLGDRFRRHSSAASLGTERRSLLRAELALPRVRALNFAPIYLILMEVEPGGPIPNAPDADAIDLREIAIRSRGIKVAKSRVHATEIGQRLLNETLGTTFALPIAVTTRQRREHYVSIGEKVPQRGLSHWFSRFAARAANAAGSHWAFIITGVLIVVWFLSGPVFGFSDTWQLIANTVTTLTTALMVFLIQNTQNRDARAIHLKLDELLRATPKARKEFMEAEEEDLDEIEREKAIVDQADPAPPKERAHQPKTARQSHRGNGKT
jgi:low affinity Fe/Cu permease